MREGRIILDVVKGDPLPQLLAPVLSASAAGRPVTPDARPERGDEIWFPSQHAFLSRLSALQETDCCMNVVIRRPADSAEQNSEAAEHAVIAALAARLAPGRLRLHALTDAARAEAARLGLAGCEVLAPPDAAATLSARPLAWIDPFAGHILLHKGEQRSPVNIHAINWARLGHDYRLVAADGTAPDWHDLAHFASALPSDTTASDDALYLFITPNGVGIGHLTRQLAIARAMQQRDPERQIRCVFWSFSRAAIIAQKAGYSVLLRHTAEHLGAEETAWRAWETAAFARFLREHRPAGVICDGNRVDPFVTEALGRPGCERPRLYWIQRGMWQSDADTRGLRDILYCDKVLIPGDLAGEADIGPTCRRNPNPPGLSETRVTPPVTLDCGPDRLARKPARRALGLRWRRTCLVSLGGDAFARTETLVESLVQAAALAGICLVWARSPLAAPPPDTAQRMTTFTSFPLSRYYDAFDGIVAAAGYNTFHELMLFYGRPVLFLPTSNARLDDQPARARFAARQGWADVLDPDAGVSPAQVFAAFFARVRAGEMVARSHRLRDGAAEMAAHIIDPATPVKDPATPEAKDG